MAKSQHEIAAAILEAALFAADKHRNCRRKGPDATPYINHPITVARTLATVGEVDDIAVLQAALLHDTVEDTKTSPEEIEEHFGRPVRDLVTEVTDDKTLEKQERKRRQIEKAPHLSPGAKMIKIADKTANLTDIMKSPPIGWSFERLQEYVRWSATVVEGCRGQNERLEALYDATAAKTGFMLSTVTGEEMFVGSTT
jgi:guanosine-3',5'-bis(diphosphate) 3'-pyrophosphohydrolase